MTNQDLENIRAVAPEWAKWCVTGRLGFVWFQEYISKTGDFIGVDGKYSDMAPKDCPFMDLVADGYTYAIDLKTGDIHVQHAGKIVVVSMAEWSAE